MSCGERGRRKSLVRLWGVAPSAFLDLPFCDAVRWLDGVAAAKDFVLASIVLGTQILKMR